jgi:hypothetical protein
MQSMGENYDEVSTKITKAIEEENANKLIQNVPVRYTLSQLLDNL